MKGNRSNVELWLPRSAVEPSTTLSLPRASERPSDRGKVLLVDDEDLVRAVTADMLVDLGYSVIEAGSGEEAMRLMNSGEMFDLLVTDHLMPRITGTELARAVRTSRPGVPVLLVSGYGKREGLDVDLPRLTKPFRKDELAGMLAEVAGTREN